jgi:uncharacterized repeat protein (TIGR02543 family)
VGGTADFTVIPNTGLVAGTYAATITVSGGNSIGASFTVSFTVENLTYSVSVNPTGTYVFPAAVVGYGAQAAKTATVTNTGNHATGALTIEKSGANADSFTVSTAALSGIAAGGNGSFTVAPVTGLGTGTYAAAITVSGGNGIGAGFSVSFTVENPTYSVSVSETGTSIFPAAVVGYGALTAKTATVTNTGNQATGALAIGISGANADSFTVSPTSLSGIAAGGTADFTVVPHAGLAAGTYTASIAVSGGNSIGAGFGVSFTVSPLYTVTFNADGGTPAASTAQTISGGTVSLPASNPVKAEYAFGGWYTAANGGGSAFTAATPVTTDITVYARWLSSNANLGSLSLSAGTLSPAFSAATTAYTVLVPATTSSVTLSAAAADAGATVSPASPYTVTLSANSTPVTFTVTAANGDAKTYTVTVNKTTATNAANVVIAILDEIIDLTRSTENDLSVETGNSLRLTAPGGYTDYVWRVDGSPNAYIAISSTAIDLYSPGYYGYGTHSVLLEYKKDGIPYGCEVLFRVVR